MSSSFVNNSASFISKFNDYLFSLEINLTDENLDEPTLPQRMRQFHKEQIEFHHELINMKDCDVQTLQEISGALNETIKKIQEVEASFRLTFSKLDAQANLSQVKELRGIADLFRVGDDQKGMERFGKNIPDGYGSLAGSVFGAVWKIKKEPQLDDIGRRSFYNIAGECVSTPMQKALAIELAMIKLIAQAFENGHEKRAFTEFQELPYRLKVQIYNRLAEKIDSPLSELERGRSCLYNLEGFQITNVAKAECFKELGKHLESIYPKVTEMEMIGLLQQDLKEVIEGKVDKENQLTTQLKELKNGETAVFQSLQVIQQVVLSKLLSFQQKSEEAAKEIVFLKQQAQDIQMRAQIAQELLRAEFEHAMRQLESDKAQLHNKLENVVQWQPRLDASLEGSILDEFIQLPEPDLEQKFADYVHQQCPNYQVGDVKKFIEEGKDLVEKIQNGQAALIPIKDRKSKIVPLVWYMLFFSVCKNQGFSHGTIVFRDPGHAICKFFLHCGQPDVYPRISSHFKERLIPTFFEGEEKKTTYGIDVPQDFKSGLPANKRTVNFCPLQTKDGLDWSFFKPEEWGLGDWYQFMGHAWDYLATRPGHFMGNPNGIDDRKEHLPLELKATFQVIFSQATQSTKTPDDVKKFGIAGMKAILESLLKDNELSSEIKVEINEFLTQLRKNYDYLDTRNGLEAILGNSFIQGNIPQEQMHLSITSQEFEELKIKDALTRLRNADRGKDLVLALSILKEKPPLVHQMSGQVDSVAKGFRIDRQNEDSLFSKEQIFEQVNKDLERFDNVAFDVDGQTFKDAELLYAHLCAVEPFVALESQQKETQVLRFMTLLQQGPRADLFIQLQSWYEIALQGVRVRAIHPDPKQIICKISVKMGKDPIIEIKQPFQLSGADEYVPDFYREQPYAFFIGTMKIDYNRQQTTISSVIVEEPKL